LTAVHALSLHDALPIFGDSECIVEAAEHEERIRGQGRDRGGRVPVCAGRGQYLACLDGDVEGALGLEASEKVTGASEQAVTDEVDRKSTRLNSSHDQIS